MTDTYFGDALSGSDGTGNDGGFTDALAVRADTTSGTDEWSSFALPELPAVPGGDIESARALVGADPAPEPARRPPHPASGAPEQHDVPGPVRVPGGRWGRLQPAPESGYRRP